MLCLYFTAAHSGHETIMVVNLSNFLPILVGIIAGEYC
ncbi:MAG: hypothetical protein ACI8SJ_002746, partial [Shewanella sp.]